MNDTDKVEAPSVRVNDRRRFDAEGKVRDDAEVRAASVEAVPEVEVSTAQAAAGEAPEAPENPWAQELQATREQLKAARHRVDELARAYQALTADREEYKQRLTRERERMLDVEKGNVAQVLLEAIDQLELSLRAAGSDTSPITQGVRMIRDGLLQRLSSMGVERIRVAQQVFDPNLAEAADMEVTTNPEDDQRVVEELAGGYRFKDRVIRPARVKVAKYVQPAQA